jgi:hypothetical protein
MTYRADVWKLECRRWGLVGLGLVEAAEVEAADLVARHFRERH